MRGRVRGVEAYKASEAPTRGERDVDLALPSRLSPSGASPASPITDPRPLPRPPPAFLGPAHHLVHGPISRRSLCSSRHTQPSTLHSGHGCSYVSAYAHCARLRRSHPRAGLSLKDQLAQLDQPAPIGVCLPVRMSFAPNSPDHQTSTPRMLSQASTPQNIDSISITPLPENTTLMSR